MRVLIVAATRFEIERIQAEVLSLQSGLPVNASDFNLRTIDFLITGVGITATAFALGRQLATLNYNLAINLGIAGSFDRSIALGQVVEVVEDTLSELGAEDGEEFLPIDELGFGKSTFNSSFPFPAGFNLAKTTAITVNTVHGDEASIKKLTNRIQPQLESMEGAAFFYACGQAGVPCLQIRAVSNYVEKRNREAWQIGLAIKNLNRFAIDFLKSI